MSAWSVAIGLGGCAWAAISDLRSRTIPNAIPLVMTLAVLLVHTYEGGLRAVGAALLGGLAVGLVPVFLFVRGALGGGDVKLLAALGVAAGTRRGLGLELDAFLLASLYALVVAGLRVGLWRFARASLQASGRLLGLGRGSAPPPTTLELPMGGAIFVAALVALVPELLR